MLYIEEKVLGVLPTFQDNVDQVKEREIRVKGCQFIEQLGRRLGLYDAEANFSPFNTVACAQFYLNYFYCFKSMRYYSYVVHVDSNGRTWE
jgi:hypothetical protein